MAKQRNAFRLGLTVLVMLALFFGSVLFIGGRQWGLAGTRFTVRFPVDAALPREIKPGGQVYCGLQLVGQVLEVRFEEATAGTQPARGGAPQLYTYLDVEVDRAVGLRQDCRITARGPLLGGAGVLQIDNRGVSDRVVTDGMLIDGWSAATFDSALDSLAAELDPRNPAGTVALLKLQLNAGDARSLVAKLHRSFDDINAMTGNLSRQLNPAERDALLTKLHTTLDTINAATAMLRDELSPDRNAAALGKVHAGLDTLNRGLQEAVALLSGARPPIDRTLASIERTADTLDRKIATPVAEQLDADDPQALLAKIHTSFERLNGSLADLNVMTDKVRDVVVLNEEQLNRIFGNVKETSDHLKAAVKDLRQNPWRLLWKPNVFESPKLNVFDAAREFSEAASSLDDALVQLKALTEARGGSLPADDPLLIQLRARLDATFEKFSTAEAAFFNEIGGR